MVSYPQLLYYSTPCKILSMVAWKIFGADLTPDLTICKVNNDKRVIGYWFIGLLVGQLCIHIESLMSVNTQVLLACFINTHLHITMCEVKFRKYLGPSQCGVQVLCSWERILFIINHLINGYLVIAAYSDRTVSLRHKNNRARPVAAVDLDNNSMFHPAY